MQENSINLSSIIEYKLTSDVSDMFGRIRLSAFVNLMIQSAIKSANSLGFGFDMLKKNNMTWMLGRLSIEICCSLKWEDKIFVETWPKTVDGLLYIRDFIVRNQKDEIVAKGTSGWLAVDLDKKRIVSIDFLNDTFYKLKDKNALEFMPVKIPTNQTDESFIRHASYFDLDINKHVTAVRYLDWMMDTFEVDFHEKNYPKEIHINYIKEIHVGHEIKLNKKLLEEGKYYFDAKNQTTGNESFKCIIKF